MKSRLAEFTNDGQKFIVIERYWHIGILIVLLEIPTIYNPQHTDYSFGRIAFGLVLGFSAVAAFIACKQTSFDKTQGVFVQETRSLFRNNRFEGALGEIHCVQVTSWFRPGNPRNDHLMWDRSRESIVVKYRGNLITVLSMTGPDSRLAGGIPPDQIATRLAQLIGCKVEKITSDSCWFGAGI